MRKLALLTIAFFMGFLCSGSKIVGRADIDKVNINTDLKELKQEFDTFKEVAKHGK